MLTLDPCDTIIDSQPDPLTHFVIVRQDLQCGMQLAQVAHAAGESSPGDLSPGTYAIVLGVGGERELVELGARLEAAGVSHRVVVESQAPYTGQAMAIGVEPGPRSELRRLFSSIPLAGCRGPK